MNLFFCITIKSLLNQFLNNTLMTLTMTTTILHTDNYNKNNNLNFFNKHRDSLAFKYKINKVLNTLLH